MNNLLPGFWQLEQQAGITGVRQALADKFSVEEVASETALITVLDDYDWDIWQADCLLVVTPQKKYRLYQADKLVTEQPCKTAVRFWWDFPQGELHEQLKSLIDLRAILPVVVFESSRHDFVLRNSDEKIIARLAMHSYAPHAEDMQQAEPAAGSHGKFLVLQPLRGYHKEFRQAADCIVPLCSQQFERLSFRSQLALCGIEPPHTKPAAGFDLSAEMPTEQAVRQMSVELLHRARSNEPGIIDDVDTEFLHQYRVNLRKVRSLIGLMKKAVPEDLFLRMKPALAELSSVTNALRDLDVFLLEHDYYQNLLPENFTVGLKRLFKMVAGDREKARKLVLKSLTSERHQVAYDEVIGLLDAEPLYQSALADKPLLKVVNKKILSRYRRICALGAEINDTTPDHEVHQLRIEGKKLRYLMEFFAELYPKKRIRKLIKPLKEMQTILGNFNDYSVQKKFLAEYENSHKKSVELSAAIGGLVAVLHQKQIEQRSKVQQAFERFGGNEIHNEFELMFGKVPEGKAL